MKWMIVWCDYYQGAGQLAKYLDEGWEPFAVTELTSRNYKVWLRKKAE